MSKKKYVSNANTLRSHAHPADALRAHQTTTTSDVGGSPTVRPSNLPFGVYGTFLNGVGAIGTNALSEGELATELVVCAKDEEGVSQPNGTKVLRYVLPGGAEDDLGISSRVAVETFYVPMSAINEVAWDGTAWWFASGTTLQRYDPNHPELEGYVGISGFSNITGLLYAKGFLWVIGSGGTRQAARVNVDPDIPEFSGDPPKAYAVETFDLGVDIYGIAYSKEYDRLFLSSDDLDVPVIRVEITPPGQFDPTDTMVLKSGLEGGAGMAFGGGFLYVAGDQGTLFKIDVSDPDTMVLDDQRNNDLGVSNFNRVVYHDFGGGALKLVVATCGSNFGEVAIADAADNFLTIAPKIDGDEFANAPTIRSALFGQELWFTTGFSQGDSAVRGGRVVRVWLGDTQTVYDDIGTFFPVWMQPGSGAFYGNSLPYSRQFVQGLQNDLLLREDLSGQDTFVGVDGVQDARFVVGDGGASVPTMVAPTSDIHRMKISNDSSSTGVLSFIHNVGDTPEWGFLIPTVATTGSLSVNPGESYWVEYNGDKQRWVFEGTCLNKPLWRKTTVETTNFIAERGVIHTVDTNTQSVSCDADFFADGFLGNNAGDGFGVLYGDANYGDPVFDLRDFEIQTGSPNLVNPFYGTNPVWDDFRGNRPEGTLIEWTYSSSAGVWNVSNLVELSGDSVIEDTMTAHAVYGLIDSAMEKANTYSGTSNLYIDGSSGTWSFYGFNRKGSHDGKMLSVTNTGTTDLTFQHESVGDPTNSHRIITPGGVPAVLEPEGVALFRRDDIVSYRWRLVSITP